MERTLSLLIAASLVAAGLVVGPALADHKVTSERTYEHGGGDVVSYAVNPCYVPGCALYKTLTGDGTIDGGGVTHRACNYQFADPDGDGQGETGEFVHLHTCPGAPGNQTGTTAPFVYDEVHVNANDFTGLTVGLLACTNSNDDITCGETNNTGGAPGHDELRVTGCSGGTIDPLERSWGDDSGVVHVEGDDIPDDAWHADEPPVDDKGNIHDAVGVSQLAVFIEGAFSTASCPDAQSSGTTGTVTLDYKTTS